MTDPSKWTNLKEHSNPEKAVTRRIRVRSEDSAFVYAVLEASEGVCAYSTLEHRPGDRHRDLELVIPMGQISEVDRILSDLQIQLAGEVYVLPVTSETATSRSE